jgi:crossover junction endodeoxyribonuclease RuvC
MSLFIGIDPGISGALCAIDSKTREVSFWDTPVVTIRSGKTFKNTMDCHTAMRILQSLDRSDGILVTIEKVNAMPSIPGPDGVARSMGATSSFNFGMNFGMWIGICAASELPYQLVHPATWKAALMKDMGREKDASRVKAMQLYPYTAKDLARKKDHARGDALLLAHYGMVFGSGVQAQKVRKPVMEDAPSESPLLFGGSSVSMKKSREVEEDDGMPEF